MHEVRSAYFVFSFIIRNSLFDIRYFFLLS